MTYQHYTVTLDRYDGLTPDMAAAAEDRYRQTIEDWLGGPEEVVTSLATLRRLQVDPGTATPRERVVISRWQTATLAARVAGFADLPDAGKQWVGFEVRPS